MLSLNDRAIEGLIATIAQSEQFQGLIQVFTPLIQHVVYEDRRSATLFSLELVPPDAIIEYSSDWETVLSYLKENPYSSNAQCGSPR